MKRTRATSGIDLILNAPAQAGDPARLRVLSYGALDFDLLPFAGGVRRPQTRIRLDRAKADVLIALLAPPPEPRGRRK